MRYFIPFALVLFHACSNQPDPAALQRQISDAETNIGANPQASDEEVKALLTKYETYTSLENADTQLVVDFMLRAGDMAARLKDYQKSLGYYDYILEKFPSNPKAPKALFMKGFTLDNRMGDLEGARSVYEEFLKKYPADDFADDAAFSLKNLGKSAEEIVKEFEVQQQDE